MKLLLWVLVPLAAQAQLTMPITSVENQRAGTVTFTGVAPLPADQGAPLSGEEKVEVTVAGPSPVSVTDTKPSPVSVTDTKWWRDAQGRTRMEESSSRIVQICDPVEGACYVLDPRDMVAHRLKYAPRKLTTVNPADLRDQKERLEALGITVESFGNRTIQGVETKGYRFNVALIHESTEVWFAPSLGIPIRRVTKAGSVETTEMVNLHLENPAPELFRVPAGYEVRDETAPFTVVAGIQR